MRSKLLNKRISPALTSALAMSLLVACTPDQNSSSPQQATAEQLQAPTQASTGRGAPFPATLENYDGYPEEQFVGSVTPLYWEVGTTASGGDVPEGILALERDFWESPQ